MQMRVNIINSKMFKYPIEEALNKQSIKKNENKKIREKILETYPNIQPFIEDIWPKDADVQKSKLKVEDFLVSVYFINNELKFIEDRDSNVIPTLRILHVYPFMMPHMQCDKGAIKHIMSGSDVMCPGLTSPGGKMADVPKDTVVAITAEGKEHAMGIGITTMSAKDIKNINKNVGIKLIMNLTDGMWKLTRPQITL